MEKKKTFLGLLIAILVFSLNGNFTDDIFVANMFDFSVEMFKVAITKNENSLISPLSIMQALAMTANGATDETLTQMEAVLGRGIPLSDLNEYLNLYVTSLPSEEKTKLDVANSIWVRDPENKMVIAEEFLRNTTEFYRASIHRAAFDLQTMHDINSWVSQHTDGMIDKVIEGSIPDDVMMYLINAVVFVAEWQRGYDEGDIRQGDFTNIQSTVQNAAFMHSEEELYLNDGKAIGFIKPYINYHYSFVALLPNSETDINEFIDSMTGESFSNVIKKAQKTTVHVAMPKFEYDYKKSLIDALKELGMPIAFDESRANFSRIGKFNVRGNIFISEVLHKTFITVDERGTKAAAVTKVESSARGMSPRPLEVRLDRPFIYAIIDNTTNLPVFMGTLMNPINF